MAGARTHLRGRFWKLLLVFFVAGAATVAPQTLSEPTKPSAEAGSSYRFKPSERCLMRKINGARARRGRSRLSWSKQVGYVARRHARRMAGARSIWHDGRLGSKITRWDRLGQNVGRGGECRRIFRAFMSSSKHRSIILGSWRFMGVGVAWAGGRMYVHHVFEWYRRPGNVYNHP